MSEDVSSIPLFSYGTLQLPEVQRATYGRLLEGRADALPGYRLEPTIITSAHAVEISGSEVHTIARRSGNPTDLVTGIVFLLTEAELAATDEYETSAYARVEATLASGAHAFVYVVPEDAAQA